MTIIMFAYCSYYFSFGIQLHSPGSSTVGVLVCHWFNFTHQRETPTVCRRKMGASRTATRCKRHAIAEQYETRFQLGSSGSAKVKSKVSKRKNR